MRTVFYFGTVAIVTSDCLCACVCHSQRVGDNTPVLMIVAHKAMASRGTPMVILPKDWIDRLH